MKKVFATICLLSLSATWVQAQDHAVRFGIKASPNLGFMSPNTKELKNDGTRFGYTFGLMGDFAIGSTGNYAFATGLYLNNVGGQVTLPAKDVNLEHKMRYQYVELPITLKLKTNEIGYMTYYGQVGFGAAFNVAAKADLDIYDAATGTKITSKDNDFMKNTNLFKASLVVGAGFEYNFSGNTALQVGITYNNGFTNIFNGYKATTDGDLKSLSAKQNYFELSLGVFF